MPIPPDASASFVPVTASLTPENITLRLPSGDAVTLPALQNRIEITRADGQHCHYELPPLTAEILAPSPTGVRTQPAAFLALAAQMEGLFDIGELVRKESRTTTGRVDATLLNTLCPAATPTPPDEARDRTP